MSNWDDLAVRIDAEYHLCLGSMEIAMETLPEWD